MTVLTVLSEMSDQGLLLTVLRGAALLSPDPPAGTSRITLCSPDVPQH